MSSSEGRHLGKARRSRELAISVATAGVLLAVALAGAVIADGTWISVLCWIVVAAMALYELHVALAVALALAVARDARRNSL